MTASLRAVLFDLDGTLADTAPDLALALNLTRADAGLPPVDERMLRPYASQGARGLLGAGMDLQPTDAEYEARREAFLAHYRAQLCTHTELFPGIAELLETIEVAGLRWGVVTNKPAWLTDPLLAALALEQRSACAISGDTAARPKPDPAPLLLAAEQLALSPADCLYVGDDRRDVTAGRAAGMRTLAAAWGYISEEDPIDAWGADAVVDTPAQVAAHALPAAVM